MSFQWNCDSDSMIFHTLRNVCLLMCKHYEDSSRNKIHCTPCKFDRKYRANSINSAWTFPSKRCRLPDDFASYHHATQVVVHSFIPFRLRVCRPYHLSACAVDQWPVHGLILPASSEQFVWRLTAFLSNWSSYSSFQTKWPILQFASSATAYGLGQGPDSDFCLLLFRTATSRG